VTSSTNPTWYDVLGVSRDASPEQIKTAWRDATDKFEPGSGSSGQFRMFNEAADVLLDPARRQAYDNSLGTPEPVVPFEDHEAAAAEPPPPPGPVATPAPPADEPRTRPVGEPASRGAWIVALVLTLLTVAALAVAGYFAMQVREDARVAEARDEAPSAAERAAKAMLAYDYRHLEADRNRAAVYLTDDFRPEYLKNFMLLEKQKDGTPGAALQTKTVVTSTVLGSGVMDAEEDKAHVLVYVNQVSKKPGVDPQIFQNRVSMTMEKHGNQWLVDGLKSY
jgi:Mce-associated membrane protein